MSADFSTTKQYTRFPLSLIRRCADSNLSGVDMRVLLVLMRYQMDNLPLGAHKVRGKVYYTSARDVADALGIAESSVRRSLSGLVAKGILTQCQRGHRGQYAAYRLSDCATDSSRIEHDQSATDWSRINDNGEQVSARESAQKSVTNPSRAHISTHRARPIEESDLPLPPPPSDDVSVAPLTTEESEELQLLTAAFMADSSLMTSADKDRYHALYARKKATLRGGEEN